MQTVRIFWLTLTFLFAFVGHAYAAEPLVDVTWLKAHLGQPDIAIIDMQPHGAFLRGHIPGAANTDFGSSGWRETRADKVPYMLPEKFDNLVAHIGSLGVDERSHVVLVAPGNSYGDVGWATYIYWTFKVLGHDQVSILNGGMRQWSADASNRLETGARAVADKSFTAHPRMAMVATVEDVKKARDSGVLLVDNRTEDQYLGINRHPDATESGTLPGALNLPVIWSTNDGGGVFRSKSQLERLYQLAHVPSTGAQINFCNTGHFASTGWFISSELLGNKKARLYDGSMIEWTITKAGPVEKKINLD